MKKVRRNLVICLSVTEIFSILAAFICYDLSKRGQISVGEGCAYCLVAHYILIYCHVMWYGFNRKDLEFTRVSRAIWTSLVLLFVSVLFCSRDGIPFLLIPFLLPLLMGLCSWADWWDTNISLKASLKR